MKLTFALLALPFGLAAQAPGPEDVIFMRQGIMGTHEAGPAAGAFIGSAGAQMKVDFLSAEMALAGKPVKGRPFSAQAVTETNQTLPDGNRIHNKSEAALHRDSEGRTRREQALMGLGPLAAPQGLPSLVFINDPVAGVNFVLEPENRIARKTPAPMMGMKYAPAVGVVTAGPAGGGETHDMVLEKDGSVRETRTFTMRVPPPAAGETVRRMAPSFKNEPLGREVIEGVQADGTRTVMTIPAGQIGNERPIEIVSERWYSPEIETVVMTRHTDPRMGETVYKLTNINRAEPAHALFEVPADYTVK